MLFVQRVESEFEIDLDDDSKVKVAVKCRALDSINPRLDRAFHADWRDDNTAPTS